MAALPMSENRWGPPLLEAMWFLAPDFRTDPSYDQNEPEWSQPHPGMDGPRPGGGAVSILSGESLFSFFYDRVKSAQDSVGVPIDEHTEFYLVNLLVGFQRTPELVAPQGDRVDDRPLAIRLLESRAHAGGDRYRQIKHIADSTLYVLGYFAESLRRSTVDLKYYAGVGETAYAGLATLSEGRAEGSGEVFNGLSQRFTDCAELISEVRDDARTDSDLLNLYEQWMVFGEDRALRRLRALGVLPAGDGGGEGH